MNSMLNDEIEKKISILKKKLEATRVNFLNSQLNSWYQDNPIESKLKKIMKPITMQHNDKWWNQKENKVNIKIKNQIWHPKTNDISLCYFE
jgi:hypothetical protein